MKVDRVLKAKGANVVTAKPSDTLMEIARLFEQKRRGLVVVCNEEGTPIGVVSLGDIVHAIGERGAEALNLPVRVIMTLDPKVCSPQDDIEEAIKTMMTLGVRHLPVVEGGKIVAVIEEREALEVLHDEQALDFEQLRNYIFKTGGRY